MKNKIILKRKNKEEIKKILSDNNKKIFNFLNLYSVYLFNKNSEFRNALIKTEKNCINFADGFPIAFYLKTPRIRGTDFTKFVLSDKRLSGNKKHFFLGGDGANEKDITKIAKKFDLPLKNIFYYNPPYIKSYSFPKQEIDKILKIINSKKPDYLWIGLGNPKQEIMSVQLINRAQVKKIFNVGAALDFLSERKKQAPLFFRKTGMEWFFRLLTDFKYSSKKVIKSFIGLFYIKKSIELRR